MPLAEIQTAVDDLVRDRDNVVTETQRDAAIQDALAQYSADAPRAVVVDAVASSAGNALDLPSGWTDDSNLVSAEYPVGQWPASMLETGSITVYSTPTVRQLRLPVTLSAGDTVRLTYTAEHLLDADDDTVPDRHRNALACLAASMLCTQLAAYYAGESEPTISADTVDRKTKSDRYRALARDLLATYNKIVGAAPSDRKQGASAIVELKRRDSLGGRRLFHPPQGWPR